MLNLSTRALALAFVCVLVASFVAPVAAQDGDGAPPVEFVIEPTATEAVSGAALVETAATFPIWGHGWGHGRGLGQYGSLGYAIDEGWTSSQILDHFYGDTTAGNVGNSLMTVRLESSPSEPLNGSLIVTVTSGTLGYRVGSSGAVVPVGAGAMRVDVLGMTASGGGIYRIFHGPGCGGPWTPSSTMCSFRQSPKIRITPRSWTMSPSCRLASTPTHRTSRSTRHCSSADRAATSGTGANCALLISRANSGS